MFIGWETGVGGEVNVYWRFMVRRYVGTNSLVIGCDLQIYEIGHIAMMGRDSSVGIVTHCGLDSSGIEYRWE